MTISRSIFNRNRGRFLRQEQPLRVVPNTGFTLIELLMVILLLGILGTVSVSTVGDSIQESRYDQTLQEMAAIRKALIGDPSLYNDSHRTDFGYLGDMGALPTNPQGIQALLAKPGPVADWEVYSTARIGTGWSGPYLTSINSADPTMDAWGNAYTFDFSSSPAVVQSLGADGATGGTSFDQDITLEIPPHLLTSTVYGFISENGAPYSGAADIDFYSADGSGDLTTISQSLGPADQGAFSFPNIPLGRRSVLIHIPDRASPTRVIGPVSFVVDRGDYIIPSDHLGFSTTGTGGGGGGCTPAGLLTYAPGTASVSGPGRVRVGFSVNISSAIVLSDLNINTTASSVTLNRLQVGGITRACPTDFATCPVPELTTISFTSPMALSAGNGVAALAEFTSNMNSETSIVFTVTHNLGCDVVHINDL